MIRTTHKMRANRNAYHVIDNGVAADDVMPAAPSAFALADKDENLRRCIISNQSLPKSSLLRLVLSPENILTPDITEKLPGRSIWITPNAHILALADKQLVKKAQKIYQTKVSIASPLAPFITKALQYHITQLLSLMRRAGQVLQGKDKITIWLKNKKNSDKKAFLLAMKPISSLHDGQKIIKLAQTSNIEIIEGLPEQIACDSFNRANVSFLLAIDGGLMRKLQPLINKYLLMNDADNEHIVIK
ncbi:MAG: DUF448 domain-containing protein [Alphaproteobacteria bacterium]|nr:DUF448 domain-containing protein [Alphaproteobacteria bacterium]